MDFSLILLGTAGKTLRTLDADGVRFFSGLSGPAPGAPQRARNGIRHLAKQAYVLSPPAVRKVLLAASRRGRSVYAGPDFPAAGSEGVSRAALLLDGREALFDLSGRQFSLGLFVEMVRQVILNDQYLLRRSAISGKTVVDAGASIGVFSIFAFLLGAKRVYSFEPDASSYGMLERNVEINGASGVVIPVEKALGSSNGKASFNGPRGSSEADVTTLDSFLRGEKVDFIKMDIEGCEKDVLSGAAASISAHHPAISMSAYHKPDDESVLPACLRSIDKSYSCNLTYLDEKDLYCVSSMERSVDDGKRL